MCREDRGFNCRLPAKAGGHTKQIVLSFHSQIAEQACHQVSFLLACTYTVRDVIIMDEDGHDGGNNNNNNNNNDSNNNSDIRVEEKTNEKTSS